MPEEGGTKACTTATLLLLAAANAAIMNDEMTSFMVAIYGFVELIVGGRRWQQLASARVVADDVRCRYREEAVTTTMTTTHTDVTRAWSRTADR